MARNTEFPDVFTIRLPAGGIAALKAVLREGETPSDAAREAVQTFVAARQWTAEKVAMSRVTLRYERGRRQPPLDPTPVEPAPRPKPLTPVEAIDAGGCAPPVYANPVGAE
mgnify:CR=1 FL=1